MPKKVTDLSTKREKTIKLSVSEILNMKESVGKLCALPFKADHIIGLSLFLPRYEELLKAVVKADSVMRKEYFDLNADGSPKIVRGRIVYRNDKTAEEFTEAQEAFLGTEHSIKCYQVSKKDIQPFLKPPEEEGNVHMRPTLTAIDLTRLSKLII